MLPDPILFGRIHMYGVMIALGVLACFVVLFLYCKKKSIEPSFVDFLFYDGIASVAVGIFFAALFQAFYNYLDNPEGGFNLGSGMTFIGGLIGGAICFLSVYFIFRRRLKGRFMQVFSIIPCCILIAHGFGRIGCFFAGCCYGKPTDSFLGIVFPNHAHLGPVHPTMLYEAAFLFIMFAVCSYLLLKHDFRHNLALYLVTYGVFRFFIEYVRGDERGELVGFVTPSQFWSIFMVGIGIALFFVCRKIFAAEAAKTEVKESDPS